MSLLTLLPVTLFVSLFVSMCNVLLWLYEKGMCLKFYHVYVCVYVCAHECKCVFVCWERVCLCTVCVWVFMCEYISVSVWCVRGACVVCVWCVCGVCVWCVCGVCEVCVCVERVREYESKCVCVCVCVCFVSACVCRMYLNFCLCLRICVSVCVCECTRVCVLVWESVGAPIKQCTYFMHYSLKRNFYAILTLFQSQGVVSCTDTLNCHLKLQS